MKILIGTPIHECKDYCMEQWLQNVAKSTYPADLFLVDNSPGLGYVEKVKGYCAKYGIKNYKIRHLEISQTPIAFDGRDEDVHERVARARGMIEQEILENNYDAWFCWECDQIIPADALDKLIKLYEAGDFSVVVHNSWAENGTDLNFGLGVALVKKDILKKYRFPVEVGGGADMPDSWYDADLWYREHLKKNGCKYVEVCGLIDPVYHLHNKAK